VAEILAAAAEVYDWPKQGSKVQEWFALSEEEQATLPGIYKATLGDEDYEVTVKQEGEGVKIDFPGVDLLHTFYIKAREDETLKLTDCTGYTASFTENDNKQTVITVMNYAFTKIEG